jgi:glycogen debranching enzyme
MKRNELIVAAQEDGDLDGEHHASGLYFRDMRHLSTLAVALDGFPLRLIGRGTTALDRTELHYVNAEASERDGMEIPNHSISLVRRRQLDTHFAEQLILTNHNRQSLSLTLRLTIAADFRDMFDVRGFHPHQPGPLEHPSWDGDRLELAYLSGDGTRFETTLAFAPQPDAVEHVDLNGPRVERRTPGNSAIWRLTLEENEAVEVGFVATPRVIPTDGVIETPRRIEQGTNQDTADWGGTLAAIRTSNERFNSVLARSLADLRALMTPLPNGGRIIAAGIPWYVTAFGRDSLITARQLLPWDAAIAAATLRFLAATQGTVDDPWRDEEPGKIIHEMRFGELARLGLTPFSRYYGTLDATPLFLWLLADYVAFTGDTALFMELRPQVDRALAWIDHYDGFISYRPNQERGLINQGWKDSHDAVQRIDGGEIVPPIALIEAQGYVYAARTGIARCFATLGDDARANVLETAATQLRDAVEGQFWMEDAGCYSEAVTGDALSTGAITSNPLHLLAAGLPSSERAAHVTRRLLQPDMFSGWGIRTLATTMPHYNPVSYHRGSVWPHDNAFGLWGFRRYGERAALETLATALFDAATHFPLDRLPELFCGDARANDADALPIEYPTTCSPQAWAAGVPLVILETLLGLRVDAAQRTLGLDPWLPDWLEWIEVDGVRVGDAAVAFRASRTDTGNVAVDVTSNPHGIDII